MGLVNSLGIVCHSNDRSLRAVLDHLVSTSSRLGEHLNVPTATLEEGLYSTYGCRVTGKGCQEAEFLE